MWRRLLAYLPSDSSGTCLLASVAERSPHQQFATRGIVLGLAIARTIVEANRGRMELSNGAEGGAIVTIEFAAVRS
jgi:K+-sensing histidine kinase KdpD